MNTMDIQMRHQTLNRIETLCVSLSLQDRRFLSARLAQTAASGTNEVATIEEYEAFLVND